MLRAYRRWPRQLRNTRVLVFASVLMPIPKQETGEIPLLPPAKFHKPEENVLHIVSKIPCWQVCRNKILFTQASLSLDPIELFTFLEYLHDFKMLRVMNKKDYRNCQKHSKKTPTYHCALKLMI